MRHKAILIVLLLLPWTGSAQFWAKKQFREWSKDDCRKLLTDSPWARSWAPDYDVKAIKGEGSISGQAVGSPQVAYIAQLRTALPVHMAILRADDLAQDGTKRAETDASAGSAPASVPGSEDQVVVQLLYWRKDPNWVWYWQQQGVGRWKKKVLLIGPRGEAEPIEFIAPNVDQVQMQFVFPRIVNGTPILQPGDKELKIEFYHPVTSGTERVLISFPAKNMTFNGKLEF